MTVDLRTATAWFLASLLVLLPLQGWMMGSLQRLLVRLLGKPRRALTAYALLLFPGVALHELSHYLMARLLAVRATSVSLLPRLTRHGSLRLGYIQTESVDPMWASLIGLAPLLSGTAALWLLGTQVLHWDVLSEASVLAQGRAVLGAFRAIPEVPWWGAWLYLAAAISNTMMPSRADRAAWGWVLVLGTAVGAVTLVLGWGQAAARLLETPVRNLLVYLASAFTATAVIDLLLGTPLWVLEVMLRRRG